MAKKVRDLDNKGHTGVSRPNDMLHIHTAGRTVGGESDFKIAFLDLFDYGEEVIRAYLYKSNTQTVTANTWTEIAWNVSRVDPFSIILPDQSGFLTPEAGLYWIYGGVEINDPADDVYMQCRILADGAVLTGAREIWDGQWQWQRTGQVQTLVYLDADVEITFQMYMQGHTETTFGGIDQTTFFIYRIGGG